jgi:transposase-like protein
MGDADEKLDCLGDSSCMPTKSECGRLPSIKLGKRLRATIRELGYPSKNALKGWYREYERQQDLPAGSAPRPPKFLETQKQAALEHYANHGRCVSRTIRALGYPGRAMLTAWVREAFPGCCQKNANQSPLPPPHLRVRQREGRATQRERQRGSV